MLLYLKHAIAVSGNGDREFFRTAYVWRFGKDIEVMSDVDAWRANATVPKYVEQYINALQHRKEGDPISPWQG